jgi:hypothetical protein
MNETPTPKIPDPYDRFCALSDTIKITLYPYETAGALIPLPAKSPYFRFTTPKIRAKGLRNGHGWDKNLTDLLAFELINDAKSRQVILSLYVGPGEESERQGWILYAEKKGQPFRLGRPRFENGKRWQSLNDEILLTKDDYDQNEDFVNELLVRNLTLFLNKKLPFFERAILERKTI